MRIWIQNHTLCLGVGSPPRVYMLRVCGDWTGKFSFHKNEIAHFKKVEFPSETTKSDWTFYTIPFFALIVARWRVTIDQVPPCRT